MDWQCPIFEARTEHELYQKYNPHSKKVEEISASMSFVLSLVGYPCLSATYSSSSSCLLLLCQYPVPLELSLVSSNFLLFLSHFRIRLQNGVIKSLVGC